MGGANEELDKVNVRYPIKHLEDRLDFVKKIHSTLINPQKLIRSDWTGQVKRAEDEIAQCQRAIEILYRYHRGDDD